MKKLCVVFPGRRYSCDRSLLYFPSRVIEQAGFEMVYMHYDIPKEIHEVEPLEENIQEAFQYCKEHLAEIDFRKYDEIIFLSKSIGTIVAANYEQSQGLSNVYQIFITPLDETLPFIEDKDLIICGDSDRYLQDAKKKLAPFPNNYIFPGFTHSLESKDNYRLTVKTIGDVTGIVDFYVRTLEEEEGA
jgi:hypothetical protein